MIASHLRRLLPRNASLSTAFARNASSQQGSFSVIRNENGMFTLKLENLKKRNAVSFALMKSMGEHLRAAAEDPKCRGVVWTGSEDFFCCGLDFFDFAEKSGCLRQDMPVSEKEPRVKELTSIVRGLIDALIDFPKPLIALVNGPAIGIGVTALPHCDLVIASDKAWFKAPFSSLGFVVEGCSSLTFPLTLGPLLANDMLLFGRVLSAEEALRHGLVSRVVPAKDGAELLAKTAQTIEEVSKLPLNAFKASKRLLKSTPLVNREALHAINKAELDAMVPQWLSSEVSEPISGFINRPKKK